MILLIYIIVRPEVDIGHSGPKVEVTAVDTVSFSELNGDFAGIMRITEVNGNIVKPPLKKKIRITDRWNEIEREEYISEKFLIDSREVNRVDIEIPKWKRLHLSRVHLDEEVENYTAIKDRIRNRKVYETPRSMGFREGDIRYAYYFIPKDFKIA